jgi:hypothetical protein
MDNTFMASDTMLDTLYIFQPRGPHTAFLSRMPTPAALIGVMNPRTGRPYGSEIRRALAACGSSLRRDACVTSAWAKSGESRPSPKAAPKGRWRKP